MKGLQIVESRKGFLRCRFVVSDRITVSYDEDGNWHVGAMATLVDVVGLFAVYSLVGHFKATVDFSFSLFSTAKALEEVELEGKVVGEKERLASVEVRKTSNRELIALGKQWMSAHSKSLHSSSKL
ncbi:hypothetical protein LINPERPRIM_LOCUS19208 [Linum perenne]